MRGALLSCGTVGAEEAVRRAREGELQLLDATWSPDANAKLAEPLAGTTAVLDTNAIKAIPFAERSPETLAGIFARSGLNDTPMIAVYDRLGLFSAAWAWWMLLECGHSCLVVQGSAETVTELPAPQPGSISKRPAKAVTATLDDVLAGGAQIIDARGPGRFQGTELEPRAGLRSGHIPGSINVHHARLKDGDRFLTPGRLHELFTAEGIRLDQPIITTCGSGVTAAALAFCLSRAGATDIRVYGGSWAEYGATDHPVATGQSWD